ncbi:MAG: hypothetical protein WDN72_02920 [Alphaproteobacteria bacterium]
MNLHEIYIYDRLLDLPSASITSDASQERVVFDLSGHFDARALTDLRSAVAVAAIPGLAIEEKDGKTELVAQGRYALRQLANNSVPFPGSDAHVTGRRPS